MEKRFGVFWADYMGWDFNSCIGKFDSYEEAEACKEHYYNFEEIDEEEYIVVYDFLEEKEYI